MKNKNKDISFNKRPLNQGLYDSNFEHDACGIGFVANIKGNKEPVSYTHLTLQTNREV